MKKVVLLPKNDTVTLCLPEKWVGVPIICKLEPLKTSFMNSGEMENEIKKIVVFRNPKRKTKNK